MKKMYFVSVFIIIAITLIFLKFCRDDSKKCTEFLSSYGYESFTLQDAVRYRIPKNFDDGLYRYNMIMLSSGYDLSLYKGKSTVKYTYKMDNLPFPLYSNIILLNGEIISADLVNPELCGFVLPMIHISDLTKYHIPAKNDAVMP